MGPKRLSLNDRLLTILAFLARLLLLAVPLYFIIIFADLWLLQAAVASQASWLLSSLGFPVMQNGTEVTVGTFAFVISKDSTGWKSLLFFSALVISVPRITGRKRLIGLAIGLPLLWIANLSRVIAIVLVQSSLGLEAALFAHDVLWQWGLIATVLGLWTGWFYWATRQKPFLARLRGLFP
jgi:exosortase/archaeosortase family protein